MPEPDPERMRPIRSFVLREGRLTAAQQRALDELFPQYGIDPEGTLDFARVFGRNAPVWLEIGFGNGDALHAMARERPDIDFLGIEVHRPGIGRLLRAVHEDGLSNVRVLRGDASDVLQKHIAARSLSRVMVFFPDPWPKKRHHKRRLVQPDFVRYVARALERNGVLHLATDWEDYAWQMRDVLDAAPEFENTTEGWADCSDSRPRTRFEERGEHKGHAVYDLIYRRA